MEPKDFIKGRVVYDNYGQYFWIVENGTQQMLAELRGWGAIQNLFKDGDGNIDTDAAGKYQDEIGNWIASAINDKLEREREQLKISSNPVLSDVSFCVCEVETNKYFDDNGVRKCYDCKKEVKWNS